MCDVCSEVLELLQTYDERTSQSDTLKLSKVEVFVVITYVQTWTQRQCMCCFKDYKNFDRLNGIIQSIVNVSVDVIKSLIAKSEEEEQQKKNDNAEESCKLHNIERETKPSEKESETQISSEESTEKQSDSIDESKSLSEDLPESWCNEEKERLLQFVAKVFLMNFPLYVAYKHSVHSNMEDPEIPVFLLRNVCLFCDSEGLQAMSKCFETATPNTLPFSLAHAMISIVSNLKLWMNLTSIVQQTVSLRSHVVGYMCKLSDKDLRLSGTRNMAEFMWTAIKEPMDAHLTCDKEGLDLAFKYFTSSTLTMRLAGITQINNHINMYNELCNNDSLMEAESVGTELANWLIQNKIIEHIFGPNLHVEIIKQSHVILNFLAMESKITNEHIDCIWSAAQLKHCSRQVHDLLPPLIKNLEVQPVLHLYNLLCKLEPAAHNNQTMYLASALIKFIWSIGSSPHVHVAPLSEGSDDHAFTSMLKGCVGCVGKHDLSSSEQSMSPEASQSDGEPSDSQDSQPHPCGKQSGSETSQSRGGTDHRPTSDASYQSEDSLHARHHCHHKTKKQPEIHHKLHGHSRDEPGGSESSMGDESELSNVSADSLRTASEMYRQYKKQELNLEEDSSDSDSGASSESETEIQKAKTLKKVLRRRKAKSPTEVEGQHPKRPHQEGSDEDIPKSTYRITRHRHRKQKCLTHNTLESRNKESLKSNDKRSEEQDEVEMQKTNSSLEVPTSSKEGVSATELRESDSANGLACEENEGTELNKISHELGDANMETEVYDCREYLAHMHSERHLNPHSELIEDILSPDDGSCNSSHISNKSEKNMADFDGEESGCEDELAQLTAHTQTHLSPHQMQQHLANVASMYHPHLHHVHHRSLSKEPTSQPVSQFDVENVCMKGSTLLWDLVQDDFACKLGEGLAQEAEKILCNLVCWSNDRRIRSKFIEGCLENLANNRSVVVSLHLLPKILGSFQQYRGGMDIHAVTMWAESEHKMMKHFFNNLLVYTKAVKSGIRSSMSLHSHQTEIQVRLQFLTCIFSSMGSPDQFRLSLEQVDILWSCLATDSECSDELFSWLVNQAKNKDQHALGLETFKHIFIEKMPLLQPENISMTALNLFQQLSSLARLASASYNNPTQEANVCGMDQLWGIALRATNGEVSMAAIQFLNNYYINVHHGTLEKEDEFVKRCMNSLMQASKNLVKAEESSLLIIQRGLILLKTHLEAFWKRYAFHLRQWTLERTGIISHQKNTSDKQASPIRIVCQPAGISDKVTIEMLGTEYVGELRAEVTRWWGQMQQEQYRRQQEQQQPNTVLGPTTSSSNSTTQPNGVGVASTSSSSSFLTPILGAMLAEGPIRMISQGQELTCDLDEKTLQELGFKDSQIVFVSVGAARPQRTREAMEPASLLPPPPRDRLPMILLLQEPHFEHLFSLMNQLSHIKSGEKGIHTKAQVMSRKVWELLMILPTSPLMMEGFKSIDKQEEGKIKWSNLLDPESPQKLMYSMQIVESLSRPSSTLRRPMIGAGNIDSFSYNTDSSNSSDNNSHSMGDVGWSKEFVERGGLSHLFNIFLSGVLQSKDEENWCEWKQDCLACLLKLMCHFSIHPSHDNGFDDFGDQSHKRNKRIKKSEKLTIPKLKQAILEMMDVKAVMKVLMSILFEASYLRDPKQYQTGFWGRAQVIHYAMSLLVSWAYSCPEVKMALCGSSNFSPWLKRLVLEAPEPAVRREACTGLYRLCLGATFDSKTGQAFIPPLLSTLLGLLSTAENMRAPRVEIIEGEISKEPFGPACRDYFWLVCRLLDNVDDEVLNECKTNELCKIDLDNMAQHLALAIKNHDYLETRHNTMEDDGLIGLLTLCTSVMKHDPQFKFSSEGQDFLKEVFDCLFALPSPKQRYLPKCKSQASRSAAYDVLVELVKGCLDNYKVLHELILQQHSQSSHSPYPWDYWPHEDGRSDCGYVGLTNLGATCYMASCMQHLYMMPQARASVLSAKCPDENKHESTLRELQRMFAYLQESERKAYNPRSFCKVYTMDHQPLNTGEQKDMAEFFTDLISKMEEMSPSLKELVKNLFCGVITNNVVSLDCQHVSRTLEEFYTVRCQVTDMKNLYESLDEVTVKDTLEGDNMYTCSQCGKKVRAEKRACFKKLPRILCFNTMRYMFNMVTMMKEKVNTHFSFPLRLDMSGYTEKHLMKLQQKEDEPDEDESYDYELIGVTVHTGTADGGHYYSFIRDRLSASGDKWYLFNDAEVKPFDPAQIAVECFGGEMTSKTYDSVTDKFMDFSFEKTNSAYMLFYERCHCDGKQKKEPIETKSVRNPQEQPIFELSKELAEWIWQDNMQFLQDKNIFEHNYFNFLWQICEYIPQTMPDPNEVSLLAAKLSTSFVLETLIHAKEKPTMVQWIELLTKQFNASQSACEWFLDHMAEDDWWPVQILIKCPNQMVRQMFQRLAIHVINKLKPIHSSLYLQPLEDGEDPEPVDIAVIGTFSCVSRFVKKLLSLIEHGAKPHSKHLTEYFTFLLDFAKGGEEECQFLISIRTISVMVNFYLGQRSSESVGFLTKGDGGSDDDEDEEEDVISLSDDKRKPASLEKMITLIALLVEKSRGCICTHRLHLSSPDYSAIAGGKSFPFLFQQTKDNINLRQTCNIIFSLCRWNERLAIHIVNMIFTAITKLNHERSQPFFKLLSLLIEFVGGPPGMPPFTNLVLQRIWEVADYCPQQCLEWLAMQVPRNKIAHSWVLQSMETWVEHFLIAHNNQRVRSAAALLLVSLVPSNHFRQAYRTTRSVVSPQKEMPVMSQEAILILHQVYELLLRLLKHAKHYVDPSTHGTMKLVIYFALMTYCLVSKQEKLLFGPYFQDLWQLFQPKLSEPPIPVHHNKQALLIFWYHVCIDCAENVKLIVQNAHITRNIAFNYILADHDDQEVMIFNRCMLPAYYGLLRLCCQYSRSFTRQLALHQNIQWAFKNISPFTTQYATAIDELFKLMRLFVMRHDDSGEQELREILHFKRVTLQLYLSVLDARSCWATLINALRILVDSHEDRLFVISHNGLPMLSEAFSTLHMMYHEATACHVTGDLTELLCIVVDIIKCARYNHDKKDAKTIYNWKDRMDFARKLLTLLNSYVPPDLRQKTLDMLRELVLLYQAESIQALIPALVNGHTAFQEHSMPMPMGPFFPRRGQKPLGPKPNVRPQRPMLQMFLHHSQIEATKGIDEEYDQALLDFFVPYHKLIDTICRVAINQEALTEDIVALSVMVAYEGVPLHLAFFPKFWIDVYQAEQVDKSYVALLCSSTYFIDYVEAVLLDERQSLNNHVIHQFFSIFLPKVSTQILTEQTKTLVSTLIHCVIADRANIDKCDEQQLYSLARRLNGDIRALDLVFTIDPPDSNMNSEFPSDLEFILKFCKEREEQRLQQEQKTEQKSLPESGGKEILKKEDKKISEENPAKKRKLSDDKLEETAEDEEEEKNSEASKKDPLETEHLGNNNSEKQNKPNWVEQLIKSTSLLIANLTKT